MSSLLRQLQVGSEASTVPELLAVERNRVQINTLMWVVGQEGSLKPGLTTRGTSSAPQKHSSKSARPMEAKPCCAFDDGHVHQLRRSGKNWLCALKQSRGAPVAVSTGAGHVPTFSGFFGEGTRDERRKSERRAKGARLAESPDPALRD